MVGQSFFRLVTLKIPGMPGGNKSNQFQFTDQADIRYSRCLALECYFNNDLNFSVPEPLPVVQDLFAPLCSLTLETNDPDDLNGSKTNSPGRFSSTTQTQKWLPCTAIHRVQSFGLTPAPFVRQLLQYKDLYIAWQKSFLNVGGANGFNNTTDIAFCLGVWYTFIDLHGNEIQRT
jgi:hypothetical protein